MSPRPVKETAIALVLAWWYWALPLAIFMFVAGVLTWGYFVGAGLVTVGGLGWAAIEQARGHG